MCSLVYLLMLRELQWRYQSQLLAATIARALGSEVDMPDWDEWRADFDTWLAARPPAAVSGDPDRLVLERSLNLRR